MASADIHGSYEVKQAYIKAVANALNVNADVILGDLINLNYPDNYMEFYNFKNWDCTLKILGNHDVLSDNSGSYDWNKQETNATLYRTFFVNNPEDVVQEANTTYWYCIRDNVMLIGLNCMLLNNDDLSAQNKFLQEALNIALEKDLYVIGLAHWPFNIDTTEIITQFNTRGLEQLGAWHYELQNTTFDTLSFDSVSRFQDVGGKFICWLNGHTHSDYVAYQTRNEHKQLFINVCSSKYTSRMCVSTNGLNNMIGCDYIELLPNDLIRLVRIGAKFGKTNKNMFETIINWKTFDVLSDIVSTF